MVEMKTTSITGLEFIIGGLTILFVALKLVGEITWSWIWVLSPLWIPLIIWIIVVFGIKFLLKIWAPALWIPLIIWTIVVFGIKFLLKIWAKEINEK